MTLSFFIAFAAGLFMLGFDIQEQHDIINHVLMITAKFGVASGCAIVYLAHSSLFPAMYAASALGVC